MSAGPDPDPRPENQGRPGDPSQTGSGKGARTEARLLRNWIAVGNPFFPVNVVDAADTDPSIWPEDVELVALDRDHGWGADRNAGLKRARGEIVIVIDGSVEPSGDVLTPLQEALADDTVGIAGPFGIVTDDLREFRDAEGTECDAVEGYLMAFRREILNRAGFFDEKFAFYRTADIEYSFRVKDQGLRAVVVPVPVERHEHRMWTNTPEDERARLSKRNFYRFLERWRGRTDLTVRGGGDPSRR